MSDKSDSLQKPAVLLVENDDLVRETIFNMISGGGYEVFQCTNGDQADRLLADNPEIGLLLSDIFLDSGMNGMDLAERARKIRPDLGILLTSAFPPAALRAHKIDVEGLSFIQKPFGVKSILALLAKSLQSDQGSKP